MQVTGSVRAGQLGCGAAAVGRNLAAQTGLAFAEIDRLIEYEAGGRSLARIAVEDGIGRLAAWADASLERLPAAALRRGASANKRLDSPGSPGLRGGEGIGLPEIHARRDSIFCDAEIVLEAGDLHANRIAHMLLESLEQIVDVEMS